ncbi:hypothetical protein AX14_007737 [Amanita brunnescens Koide BX004]|nr:hypothetical protein AX14_007737 [Amanita brunnescens Koide BX004]
MRCPCISPILSAIYLAAGIKVASPLPFPPPNIHSLFFMDDGLLYCSSKSLAQNARWIETALERIQTALAKLGLFIDIGKTELIHFPGFAPSKTGRKLAELVNQLSVKIRNAASTAGNDVVEIKPKNTMRYLGFFLDSMMNWNAHISFYFNRAFSTICALRMLGSSIRGLGTLQKRHAYQACVIPVLAYGLPLWYAYDGAGIKKQLSRVNKVHTHACKWITGCFRTTPIRARETIAGLPPLVLLLNAQLHGLRARIAALPHNHILRSSMEQKWTNLAYATISRKTRPTHLPSNQPGKRVLDKHSDRVVIDTTSPKKGTELFKAWVRDLKKEIHQMHEFPNSIIVYTDGAYHHSDHKASYAFTVFDSGSWHDHFGWCPAASSFDAEMRAIESALEHITTRTTHGHVTLIIDNKAAANALFNFDVKSSQMTVIRINMLITEWFTSNQHHRLTIRFAPSHEGIPGNGRADSLTKAGLGLCPTNPPTILRSHFIATQKRQAEAEWQRLWSDTTYRGSQWLPIRRKKKVFKPSFAKPARNFFHNLVRGEPSHLSRIAHVFTTGSQPTV